MTKLHLGCGQRYLEGYRNIDFPASEHTVQEKPVADELLDFTTLQCAPGSIEEVRLHHVFEHFPRPQAVGLLVCWYFWLEPGGLLRIEVPDFLRQTLRILNPLASARSRRLGIRHIFGSHEARWAVHCEGWTVQNLSDVLRALGFRVQEVTRSQWLGTCNLELVAVKLAGPRTRAQQEDAAQAFFRDFLVDDSAGERTLLSVWQRELRAQLARGLP